MNFSQIDRIIHEKARLSVMTILMSRGTTAFQTLKADLDMSDGNLLTHMRILIKEGYVREQKSTAPDSGRPWTSYDLTAAGASAFKGYLRVLEEIVKTAQPK